MVESQLGYLADDVFLVHFHGGIFDLQGALNGFKLLFICPLVVVLVLHGIKFLLLGLDGLAHPGAEGVHGADPIDESSHLVEPFFRVAPADGLVGGSGTHDVDGGGDERKVIELRLVVSDEFLCDIGQMVAEVEVIPCFQKTLRLSFA